MSADPGLLSPVGAASGNDFSVRRSTAASRVSAVVLLVVLVVLVFAPQWSSRSILQNLIEFLTLVALAELWNLLAGYAGLVSIGQQAYIGLGAYALVWFSDNRGVNPFISILLAGLLGALVSLPTAALTFRLRAGYFAVATWVVAEVFHLLVINVPQLDVGAGSGTSLLALSNYSRADRAQYVYWMALAAAITSMLAVYGLLRSRFGLALRAVRDGETAAEGLGVRVGRLRLWVYVLCAFGTSVVGAVIYLNLLRVQPDSAFSVNWTADMIFIVMIGGLGTIEGPIIGAALFFALEHVLSDQGTWYLIILGATAILIMVFMPEGIWGQVERRTGLRLFPTQRMLVRRYPAGTHSINAGAAGSGASVESSP